MLNLPLIGLFSYIEKFNIIYTFIFSYWSVWVGDRRREKIVDLGYRIKQRYVLVGTVEKFKSFNLVTWQWTMVYCLTMKEI